MWLKKSIPRHCHFSCVRGAHYLVDTDKSTKVLQNPSKCHQNTFSGKNMLEVSVVEIQAVAHRVSFNRKQRATKHLACFSWDFGNGLGCF